jgi:hypothetical protein
MYRFLPLLLIALVFAPSAVPSRAVAAEPGAAEQAVRLTVDARYRREDGEWLEFPVADGDVLRSGNGLRIRVEVLAPAYLHVALVGSSGKAFLAFPTTRAQLERKAPVGGRLEIPPEGQFFTLDDTVGQEAVFAFAASEPLTDPAGLIQDLNEPRGDIEVITAYLRERFPEVHRVAFAHISDSPLVGVDPALPLEAAPVDEPEAAAGAGRQRGGPAATPRRPPQASFSVVPRAGVDEMDEVLSGEGSLIPERLPGR